MDSSDGIARRCCISKECGGVEMVGKGKSFAEDVAVGCQLVSSPSLSSGGKDRQDEVGTGNRGRRKYFGRKTAAMKSV